MKAMILNQIWNLNLNSNPLQLADIPEPSPKSREILVKVTACGVCHTELDEIEGRTSPPNFPIVPGHQVVGKVIEKGSDAKRFNIGDRVGIAWIFSSCGICSFCLEGDENLCPQFMATGRDANGGYAQRIKVNETFAYPIPEVFTDSEAAPLLCAGSIGYRSLQLSNIQDGQNLGLTGFGASAHIVMKLFMYLFPNSKVFVFSRSKSERDFALELGAAWSGEIGDSSPIKLDSIIDTTPVWRPVIEAMRNLTPGGRLVINAIRKEDTDKRTLLELEYPAHLWMEKEIKSVANVSRRDVSEFLEIAARIPIKPVFQEYALTEANQALLELKNRKIRGAKVLKIDEF